MSLSARSLNVKVLAIALALMALSAAAFSQDNSAWSQNVSPLPSPTGFINDYAGVIDAAAKARMETTLRDFRERTGVELAVAVVRTTGDRDIFDYSLAVARGWGIGAKADDNPGALMMIAIDDRKYFTQISRDLEDELPDGLAGSLQRQHLVPEFRKGNYAKGIADTLDAYISTIDARLSGGPPPAVTDQGETEEGSLFGTFCCLAIGLFILLLIWSNRSGNRKSSDDEDRWGGGGGGIASALPWIILSGLSNSGGSSSSGWGSSSDWGSSGGSDWGGFGGGGDFGGGGAGGGW